MLVDLHMPGASGLELQTQIGSNAQHLPIIFITGGGDTESGVRAMKHGALDFLTKPLDEEKLLSAIARATKISRAAGEQANLRQVAENRVAKLTPRETEIMNLVVTGKQNKQIAAMLGISEKTVKVHRGRVMQKVAARTVADLVHVAEAAAGSIVAAPSESSTT